jgi:hypothetical protein
MAAMLLIYLWLTWMVVPADVHHEVYTQPAPISLEVPNPDHSVPLDPPPPSGGIAIEK